MAGQIGADSVKYNSIDAFVAALGIPRKDLCLNVASVAAIRRDSAFIAAVLIAGTLAAMLFFDSFWWNCFVSDGNGLSSHLS